MKIALVRMVGRNCYECAGEAAYHVSEWYEVTTAEYYALLRYCTRQSKEGEVLTILQEPYPREKVAETIQEALAYQAEWEEKEKKEQESRKKKKAEKDKAKQAHTLKEKKALLAKLKEELEG